jgi:signal transduction histidine kinase
MSSAPNVIEFPAGQARIDHLVEDERRRAASEERLRIARELHDVVAYSFAAIKVQVGVALHLLDDGPEPLVDALKGIDSASKDALGELREILGLLRGGDDAGPGTTAPRVDDLQGLAATMTAAGLQTRIVFTGGVRTLPPAVDLTAFRIVQESLANALRHAGPTAAVVTIAFESGSVTVQVENEGGAQPDLLEARGSSRGIIGMRERVEKLGGSLEVGWRPGGGFRVNAHLPLFPRR